MSSKNNNYENNKHLLTQYQPLTTNMDTTVQPVSAPTGADSADSGGILPSTNSSQQLMASSDSESFGGNEGGRRHVAGVPASGRNQGNSSLLHINRSQVFTVCVLCFVNLINYMDRFTIAGVLTDIQADFKIGDDDGGLLQTVFVLSYMICAPIFGYLGDRCSRPWIMAIGVLLWSTTTLLGSYMTSFGWFMTFRALVGIGEASYSTIAPTIISDLFVNDMRSRMLAMFYFAIPVGSGFGYIIGSETARLADNWRWALRVTPFLGIAAVVLILLIKDPERGESEGSHNLAPTTYREDIGDLLKNRSFMLSTAGFTCVAFVAGALSWWGPKFMFLGLRMQPGNENLTLNTVSYKFGITAMFAGLIGVPLGSYMATRLRPNYEACDPYICAGGLLTSAPMVFMGLIMPRTSEALCLLFVFLAQISLNLCWAIVADILLYVVVPTRRSTAEAFQILISHAFGDAGSPYMVGILSEAIKKHLRQAEHHAVNLVNNELESLSLTLAQSNITDAAHMGLNSTILSTTTTIGSDILPVIEDDTNLVKFEALQYALFSTSFVEVIGGIFFLITAAFILKDKRQANQGAHELNHESVPSHARVDIDDIS